MRNYQMIVTERGNFRRKPIHGVKRYGQDHAERLARQRTTSSYTYVPNVVA
jgi:hypothetical protein